MTKLLVIKQLSVQLQNKVIFDDVSFNLNAGDILGLVGPSGCGKTTLLNTLAGFIEQMHGEIILNIEDPHQQKKIHITTNTMIAPEHRNIGMIFQDYALFPHLSVEKNILFGIAKLSNNEQQLRLSNLIKLLKLDNLEQRFPHQLSGGQQQRVAIARALARQPKLLLLDEPFSNIDARLRKELMLEMRKLLKQLKISAIFVTHNKEEVFTFADKMAVMSAGKVLQIGSPVHVCQRPNSWQVADFLQLGTCLPVKKVNTDDVEETKVQSALGIISLSSEHRDFSQNAQLLLKPQFIELCINKKEYLNDNALYLDINDHCKELIKHQEQKNNAQINHILITEQGYHYLLNSLTEHTEFAFEKLSFYSDILLELGQEISIKIKKHDYIVFTAHP
ncbi:MAG: iron(III) transport system ATP-binding protein [Alteromonadaceae bacterium]